jgi:gamma-glutamyl AIG2-like cyclotransferase
MRYNTVIEELSSRPLYIFAAFVLLLLIFHLVLLYWMKLNDQSWKRVDYVWLGLAVLGLLSASAQSEHFLSKRYLETFERPRTQTAYKLLRMTLDSYTAMCLPRQRTPASPPNFDEIVQEQQTLCRRAQEIMANMPTNITDNFPPLEKTGYEPFGINAKYEKSYVRSVAEAAEQYREQQKRYEQFVSAGNLSLPEETLTVFGPFLLAFALALRITKVTGDIRNSERKTFTLVAYVFQYGSNMSAARLNSQDRLRGDARAMGAMYTDEAFELTFDVWSTRNHCAAADIVSGNGRQIWGVLYEIPDYLVKRETSGNRQSLDAIEGARYERVPISLRQPDGTAINQDVITYVVRDSERQSNIRTSLDYCRYIISGLRDYSGVVPNEYVDYAKAQMIANNPDLRDDLMAL